MEQALLRKVQLTLLEIAKEIRRVCQENGIPFFLDAGSFLGAVRHQGFIPWDDDMDVGMLREHYNTFCRIAPEKLGKDFVLQSWYTEPNYGLPFGKVMLRGTLYLEGKKTGRLAENGFYVDVFPYDNAPTDPQTRKALAAKLLSLYRVKLMKSGYRPWIQDGKTIPVKRAGYLYYQARALFTSGEKLAREFDGLASGFPAGDTVYLQDPTIKPKYFDRAWCENLSEYSFEGETFPGPRDFDPFLTTRYGDYMTPPPEDQRENRHQIVQVDFGARESV